MQRKAIEVKQLKVKYHPNIWKMQQSNLTQNVNANTMFLAKMSPL